MANKAATGAENPPNEIEITKEMFYAVDGIRVTENDFESERQLAYASIFSNMLMASSHPQAKAINRVVFKGALLGCRRDASDKSSSTECT